MRIAVAVIALLLGLAATYSAQADGRPPLSGGAPDTRRACAFWVASTGGSDSNSGTSASQAFATLPHLQSALASTAQESKKVGCLTVGSSFTLTSAITLTKTDTGETWESDPAGPVNAATINGNGHIVFAYSEASDTTINGIKILGCGVACIANPNSSRRMSGNTIYASDISGNSGSGPGALQMSGVTWDNCVSCAIKNNYVHDTTGPGITLAAYQSGESIDGSVISGNVVINACNALSDCGAIYTNMFSTHGRGGSVTIKNNFIRGQGYATATDAIIGIYLDDTSSNVTVTGNIVGPPCAGCINTRSRNNASCFLINDDGYNGVPATDTENDEFTGNICDLGASAMVQTGVLGGSGNSYTGNIVVSNFIGGLQTCTSGLCGYAYIESKVTANLTLKGNLYVNNAPGGRVFFNGNSQGDSAPVTATAAQLGCSGHLYALATTSVAYRPPVNFPRIAGHWGPPQFAIPVSINKSCTS
jgi:hypothetical protein